MLTENDLKLRLGRITSSTAAACLGLDGKMTQIEAWLRIRGETPREDPKTKQEHANLSLMKKAIERGNLFEDIVLEYGGDYLGELLKQPVVTTPAPFRSNESWLGDSCDALYFPDNGHVDPADPYADLLAIGEGKTASMRVGDEYGAEGTDEIPNHTLLQSHMHLIHWPQVDRCIVPVLVGGYRFELRAYVVKRDTDFEEVILEDLYQWHKRYIIGGDTPPATCADDSWLRRRFPEGAKGALADSPAIRTNAFAKWRATKMEGAYKKQACAHKSRLMQQLGEHTNVRAYWGKVTWTNNAPSFGVDWAGIAESYLAACDPEDATAIIAANTGEKIGARVLRVSVKKEYHDEAWSAEDSEPGEEDDDE